MSMNEPSKTLSIVGAALRIAIVAVFDENAQKEANAECIDARSAQAAVLGTVTEVAEQLHKAGYYSSLESAMTEMGIPPQMVLRYIEAQNAN